MEDRIELEYERATNGKRIAAFLLDFVLSLITGALFLILTFYILSSAPGMKEINQERESIQLNSSLYVREENKVIYLSEALEKDKNKTIKEKNEAFDKNMTLFYQNDTFFKDDEGMNIYLGWKENAKGKDGEALFDKEGLALYDDALHEQYYSSFYNNSFNKSLNYLYKNVRYASLNQKLILIDTFSILGTLLFPLIIYFYIIPMCFRRTRQTLGMLATRIGLIDVNGLAVSPYKFTFRFLFFYIVEIWLSLFTFLIPVGVSFGMLILSKTHQSLHDYVFNTYVVNIDEKMIFKDIYEYKLSERNHQKLYLESKDSSKL